MQAERLMQLRVTVANITPKGSRVQQLMHEGLAFNEAFAIADREYISDGLSLTQVGEAAAQMEVHA